MGRIEYESFKFRAPTPPIDESIYLMHKKLMHTNQKSTIYKNELDFYRNKRSSIIILCVCLPGLIVTNYYEIKPDWIGLVFGLATFVVGIKFMPSYWSYLDYVNELNKFNRRINNKIKISKTYQEFFKSFYSDKRYYEETKNNSK